jgi:Tfp pilus assembly protein PilN
MRAINLIPADARSGGGAGAGGRSGGAVYVLLGGLTALVAMAAVWGMTASGLTGKRSELSRLQHDIARAQAHAAGPSSPGDMQALRASRTATVRALAQQRLDWAATLDAIGRTLPADTTLTSLDASSTGTATGSAGAAPALTGAPTGAGPTVQLGGCAPSQRAVAGLMPRLRTIPGVLGVQLVTSSIDPGNAGGSGGASTAGAPCRGASFDLVLAFEALTPPVAPAGPAGATAAAPAAPADGSATAAVPAPSTAGTGAGR